MSSEDVFLDPDYLRFHDWMCWRALEGVEFYAGLAQRWGPPVLDVGCCTGALSITLAREGHEVVGLESSPLALELAKAHLEDEPPSVRQKVSFGAAGLVDFDLGREFGLVLLAGSAAFRLPGRYSLTQCLRQLYRHTRPGGLAVLDVAAPRELTEEPVGRPYLVDEGVNPATGLLTRHHQEVLGITWDAQVVRMAHIFTEGQGEAERKFRFQRNYHWLERDEGVALLQHAGFPEVQVWGDYEQGEFTLDSPRLIFAARRLERDVF